MGSGRSLAFGLRLAGGCALALTLTRCARGVDDPTRPRFIPGGSVDSVQAPDAGSSADAGASDAEAALDAAADTGADDAALADADPAGEGEGGEDASEDASGPLDPGEQPGDFPRADERLTPSVTGSYAVTSYSAGLVHPDGEYTGAVVMHPVDAAAPYAAVVFCPDTGSTWDDDLDWWADSLASQGFVVMGIDPVRVELDGVAARVDDLAAAVSALAAENAREDSPLYGKLAWQRIAVAGHGTGGAAALAVAAGRRAQIRAVLSLQPRQRGATFPNIDAPTFIFAAQNDTAASDALRFYESVPDDVEKIFAEFEGGDETLSTNESGQVQRIVQSRYVISFLKLYLEDNTDYERYLYGDDRQKTGGTSAFMTSRDE